MATTAIRIIAGLGNPGKDYSGTRHNAGFWFVDRLLAQENGSFSRDARLHCDNAHLRDATRDIRVIKPLTYMNESGRSISQALNYFKLQPEELLVVHDEVDFPPGIIRLKQGGGHGGHNGLRSIIAHLGTNAFNRLRIGVGHPGHKDLMIGAVLNRPPAAERALIDAAIERGLAQMPLILAGELEKAMNGLHSGEPATGPDEDGAP
ncbi:MAG TPA: aminoacyl-tRNA hydrolase [Gammaproteobacteria bacterium]|nr:aminoacyl-tRNA hydrolase [Gammaproteobacteria bacterium]